VPILNAFLLSCCVELVLQGIPERTTRSSVNTDVGFCKGGRLGLALIRRYCRRPDLAAIFSFVMSRAVEKRAPRLGASHCSSSDSRRAGLQHPRLGPGSGGIVTAEGAFSGR